MSLVSSSFTLRPLDTSHNNNNSAMNSTTDTDTDGVSATASSTSLLVSLSQSAFSSYPQQHPHHNQHNHDYPKFIPIPIGDDGDSGEGTPSEGGNRPKRRLTGLRFELGGVGPTTQLYLCPQETSTNSTNKIENKEEDYKTLYWHSEMRQQDLQRQNARLQEEKRQLRLQVLDLKAQILLLQEESSITGTFDAVTTNDMDASGAEGRVLTDSQLETESLEPLDLFKDDDNFDSDEEQEEEDANLSNNPVDVERRPPVQIVACHGYDDKPGKDEQKSQSRIEWIPLPREDHSALHEALQDDTLGPFESQSPHVIDSSQAATIQEPPDTQQPNKENVEPKIEVPMSRSSEDDTKSKRQRNTSHSTTVHQDEEHPEETILSDANVTTTRRRSSRRTKRTATTSPSMQAQQRRMTRRTTRQQLCQPRSSPLELNQSCHGLSPIHASHEDEDGGERTIPTRMSLSPATARGDDNADDSSPRTTTTSSTSAPLVAIPSLESKATMVQQRFHRTTSSTSAANEDHDEPRPKRLRKGQLLSATFQAPALKKKTKVTKK